VEHKNLITVPFQRVLSNGVLMKKGNSNQYEFKPTLGLLDALSISIGAIIGAGIFIVVGITAKVAGSALVVSMLLAAIIAVFTALSFAELTAWQPREGSIYEYTYQLISPFAGFLTGWMWIVSNTFAGAAVSLGFASYLAALFPLLPVNWVAAVLCISFTIINFLGVRQTAMLNNILVATKLLILAFFVVYGLLYFNAANLTPFAPLNLGVFYGAFYIFFAYGGFARVAVVAEEVKDAKHNVPKAILLSLAISTIVYVLVGFVAVGLIGADELAKSSSPLTDAISMTNNMFARYFVAAGGLLATASVLLSAILGVSRMTYAMARRRDLPEAFYRLHPKFNTPHYSIWIVGLLMVLLVLLADLDKVVAISTFALLFYYTLANICAIRVNTLERSYPRIIPVLGAYTCLALLVFAFLTSPESWITGIICLAIGALYYSVKQKFFKQERKR
jgi:APA family basic amino acid/polyamine antiporter